MSGIALGVFERLSGKAFRAWGLETWGPGPFGEGFRVSLKVLQQKLTGRHGPKHTTKLSSCAQPIVQLGHLQCQGT